MVKPCWRVASSRTGRFNRRAAMAIQAVRWVMPPREPKAPPMKREMARTSAGSALICLPSAAFRP